MTEQKTHRMSFANQSDGKQQQANRNCAKDFRNDREIIDHTCESNAEVIDQRDCEQDCDGCQNHVPVCLGQSQVRDEIICHGIANSRHAGNELHNHDPARPPSQPLSCELPRPLIGIARQRDLPRELRKNQRDEELPRAHDEPSPNKRRTTDLQS